MKKLLLIILLSIGMLEITNAETNKVDNTKDIEICEKEHYDFKGFGKESSAASNIFVTVSPVPSGYAITHIIFNRKLDHIPYGAELTILRLHYLGVIDGIMKYEKCYKK